MWLWFAATFAGLLGVSLGRTARSVRVRRRARLRLAPRIEEWRQHTIDITIGGTGDIALATRLDATHGLTRAFEVISTDGALIQVPAGMLVTIAAPFGVVDGTYHTAAGAPFSLFVLTLNTDAGAMRTPGRISEGARLVLLARGGNPAQTVDRLLDVRWRTGRVASAIALPAGLVALIALDPRWVALGIAGVAVLAFDAVFVRSQLIERCTTSSPPPQLPP